MPEKIYRRKINRKGCTRCKSIQCQCNPNKLAKQLAAPTFTQDLYIFATSNGLFEGTIAEFLEFMKGPKGDTGGTGGEVTSINGQTGDVTLGANDIPYDNTESELEAENVQEAIDEIVEDFSNKIDVGNVLPTDLGLTETLGVPVRSSDTEWIERSMSTPPTPNTIPLRTAGLGANGGRVKTNDAIQDDDAVAFGQLNDILDEYNPHWGTVDW